MLRDESIAEINKWIGDFVRWDDTTAISTAGKFPPKSEGQPRTKFRGNFSIPDSRETSRWLFPLENRSSLVQTTRAKRDAEESPEKRER